MPYYVIISMLYFNLGYNEYGNVQIHKGKGHKVIILRNFERSDAQQLQKHAYGDMSQEDLQALIETWNKKEYKENYFEMYAIEENGSILGQASLYGRSEHIVSCGLELYPAYRGKGYATQAYRQLLTLAEQKGYTIAIAQVRADNAASIVLNKKMGFEAEDYTYINKKGDAIYYFIKTL